MRRWEGIWHATSWAALGCWIVGGDVKESWFPDLGSDSGSTALDPGMPCQGAGLDGSGMGSDWIVGFSLLELEDAASFTRQTEPFGVIKKCYCRVSEFCGSCHLLPIGGAREA